MPFVPERITRIIDRVPSASRLVRSLTLDRIRRYFTGNQVPNCGRISSPRLIHLGSGVGLEIGNSVYQCQDYHRRNPGKTMLEPCSEQIGGVDSGIPTCYCKGCIFNTLYR